MTDELLFMMGNYEARIPTDRLYSENHLWLQPAYDEVSSGPSLEERGSIYQVGFTAYSVRLLQDVYFLDWSVDAETAVRQKQEIGEIESSKALSTLYAPQEGHILEFHEELLDDPSAINTDNYGDGWLYRFQSKAELLTPEQYVELLTAGWEKTQQLLKGQMN